jgi:glycosyltransferase involved in cell wall biosynthesis
MNVLIMTPQSYRVHDCFNHLFRSLMLGMTGNGIRIKRIVTRIQGEDKCDVFEAADDTAALEYLYVNTRRVSRRNFLGRYVQLWLTQFMMCCKSLRHGAVDVILEDASHASLLTLVMGWIRGIPTVLLVQDVWPDNAVETGLISRNGISAKLFGLLQKPVYKLAARIIVNSDDVKQLLVEKGVESQKIEIIPVWGYSDEIYDIGWRQNRFAAKCGLSKDLFYAVYAGNIGMMQDIGVVLDAAKLLANNTRIRFLIVGDGVRKDEFVRQAVRDGLDNVDFFEMQPEELAPDIYSAAGVNIITLMPGGIRTACPSKTPVCLSCGRPLLLCVEEDSLYARLIESYGAGMAVGAANPGALSAAIEAVSEGRVHADKRNAYKCFGDHFSKSLSIQRYCDLLRATAHSR